MKDDHTTNSHYLPYTFLVKRLGECTFLTDGVKGLGGRMGEGGMEGRGKVQILPCSGLLGSHIDIGLD